MKIYTDPKKRKNWLILCLTVLMMSSFLLAGCGSKAGDETRPDSVIDSTAPEPIPVPEPTPAPEPTPEPAEPMFTEIRHDVINAANKPYFTEAIMEGYHDLLEGIYEHKGEVRLTDSFDDNLSIMGCLKENPYAFVVEDYELTDDHMSIWLEYKYPKETCDEMLQFIDDQYLEILNSIIRPDMNELEKVLAVYKYFAENIAYDYEWLDALNNANGEFDHPDIAVYEALNNHKGVCHTYTYLVEFALEQLDIDCIRLIGQMKADENSFHMWPLVWIDGQAYHLDPTWDGDKDSASLYYFGMTDIENEDRGIEDSWSVDIDTALDGVCDDNRFESFRDICEFELIGNHQMEVRREDGRKEIIDLN